MQEAVPVGEGAMAAILGLDAAPSGARAKKRRLKPAGSFLPRISTPPARWSLPAHTAAVVLAGERAKALGAKRVIPLAVSAPFHCALMKPAEERLAPELRALDAKQSPHSGRCERGRRAKARCRKLDRSAGAAGLVSRCAGRRSSGD